MDSHSSAETASNSNMTSWLRSRTCSYQSDKETKTEAWTPNSKVYWTAEDVARWDTGHISYSSRRSTRILSKIICVWEGSKYENIHIRGLKGGIKITEMIEEWWPFADEEGHSSLTLGLSKDLPITTLYGLTFQIKVKLTINLVTLQRNFKVEMLEPKRTTVESLDYKPVALSSYRKAQQLHRPS
jgi:hypothetical protein